MQDIRAALEFIGREALKRNREICRLRKKGWRLSRIADKMGISRQRVQQIVKRNGR